MDAREQQQELLSAYLDGELTPQERAEVEALLRDDAQAREDLASMRAASEAVQQLPARKAPPAIMAGLRAQMAEIKARGDGGRVIQSGEAFRNKAATTARGGWVKGALSVAAILMVGVLVFIATAPLQPRTEFDINSQPDGLPGGDAAGKDLPSADPGAVEEGAQDNRAHAFAEKLPEEPDAQFKAQANADADGVRDGRPEKNGVDLLKKDAAPGEKAKQALSLKSEKLARTRVEEAEQQLAETAAGEARHLDAKANSAPRPTKKAPPAAPMAPVSPSATAAPPAPAAEPGAPTGQDKARFSGAVKEVLRQDGGMGGGGVPSADQAEERARLAQQQPQASKAAKSGTDKADAAPAPRTVAPAQEMKIESQSGRSEAGREVTAERRKRVEAPAMRKPASTPNDGAAPEPANAIMQGGAPGGDRQVQRRGAQGEQSKPAGLQAATSEDLKLLQDKVQDEKDVAGNNRNLGGVQNKGAEEKGFARATEKADALTEGKPGLTRDEAAEALPAKQADRAERKEMATKEWADERLDMEFAGGKDEVSPIFGVNMQDNRGEAVTKDLNRGRDWLIALAIRHGGKARVEPVASRESLKDMGKTESEGGRAGQKAAADKDGRAPEQLTVHVRVPADRRDEFLAALNQAGRPRPNAQAAATPDGKAPAASAEDEMAESGAKTAEAEKNLKKSLPQAQPAGEVDWVRIEILLTAPAPAR